MANGSYIPAYQHTDWIDNVDRVEAGGAHGLNQEFDDIENEFLTISRALGALGGDLSVNSLTWGNNSHLNPDQGGSIELGGDNDTAGTGTPYIDFHYDGKTQDFNARIINDADGQLSIQGAKVSIDNGLLTVNSGMQANGVSMGIDGLNIGFTYPYESVGVINTAYNLRLVSSNSIIFHSGASAAAPNTQRGSIDAAGNFTVTGGLTIGGTITSQNFEVTADGHIGVGGNSSAVPGLGGGVNTWDLYAHGGVYAGTGANPANPATSVINAAMYNDGTMTAIKKPFVIKHPVDENLYLVHGAIEGPEYSVFYRGEGQLTDGRTTIRLPGYFESLCRVDGRTVQVTPKADDDSGSVGALAVTAVRDGEFAVVAASETNPRQSFYWCVMAVRADVAPLEPEPSRAAGHFAAVGGRPRGADGGGM